MNDGWIGSGSVEPPAAVSLKCMQEGDDHDDDCEGCELDNHVNQAGRKRSGKNLKRVVYGVVPIDRSV